MGHCETVHLWQAFSLAGKREDIGNANIAPLPVANGRVVLGTNTSMILSVS